jgi:uncharacterized damage-inducible protein DinB
MNKLLRLCLMVGMMISGPVAASAQTQDKPKANADQPLTVTAILNRSVTGVERELVPAAEAMPEDKYSFAPTAGEFKGVRNFGQQVRHVAATNYAIAAALLQEKAPVDLGKDGDEGPASMTSKADIVKYLKDSLDYVHKALATVNDKNPTEMVQSPFGSNKSSRLGLSILLVGHMFDHYGQVVEYLRMNGIVPPASRPQ